MANGHRAGAGDDESGEVETVGPPSNGGWFSDPSLRVWSTPLAVLLLAALVLLVMRRLVVPLVSGAARRSRTAWDDVLIKHKVFTRLVPIAPLLVLGRGVGLIVGLDPRLGLLVERVVLALIVIVATHTLGALLTALNEIYSNHPMSPGRPIKSYLQGFKVIAYIAAGIMVVATLLDQSPLLLLSGLGAMTAILLLLFRDTILSFVAGIQLTSNDLLRVGDWIEMPQFDADGDVVDISLNTVKVQNWDRTLTVIPTHKFLDNAFKNWRHMFESGGRRIKRALRIDIASVKFLDAADIQRLSRIVLLREYMQAKVAEVAAYNRDSVPSDAADLQTNGRHLTNLGSFRAYVERYLRANKAIHQKITMLVRQLEATPQGVPIEIYAYTSETGWAAYEALQADIFDHLLAIAPEFGLRVFQAPSGADLARLTGPPGPVGAGERRGASASRGPANGETD